MGIIIIILSIVFSTSNFQERKGRWTENEIRRKEKIILDLSAFMLETNTTRLMYDSLDDDDQLKRKMKKLDVDFIRLRYKKNDFDPGDSTITFSRNLRDIRKDCGEKIIYDFSKYEQNYTDYVSNGETFNKVSNRVYYRKYCNIRIKP